jgi:hypothetical protein
MLRKWVQMERPAVPSWKQVFDTVDRNLGTKLNDFARSENFAIIAGLVSRSRTELASRSQRSSRQVLHLLNLPAASDVNRLLAQIGLLEREVRELRKQLDEQPSEATAALISGGPTTRNGRKKVTANGVSHQSRVRSDEPSS